MRNHVMIGGEGYGGSGSAVVTPAGLRLPDQPACAVMLANFNVSNDSTFPYDIGNLLSLSPGAATSLTTEGELYWGFNGVYSNQLFPGDSTPLLPINNLHQIYLRARPGYERTVWYTWFW